MSLDFTILGPTGAPMAQVPLDEAEHQELVMAAIHLGLTQTLQAIGDYYVDAEITPKELPRFADDVERLRNHQPTRPLRIFLARLATLIKTAEDTGHPIHAIAD